MDVVDTARAPVPLDRAEGRFVAVVIHDHDAHDAATAREADELLHVVARARKRQPVDALVFRTEIGDVDGERLPGNVGRRLGIVFLERGQQFVDKLDVVFRLRRGNLRRRVERHLQAATAP